MGTRKCPLSLRMGFTTLAFDHRGFGESEGRPQHEDSQGKLADLRAAVTLLLDTWTNRVTRGSLHSLMTLDVLGARPLLPRSLIVHGRIDDYCSPELAEAMHADETVWLDCSRHVDLYDTEPYVTQAVTATTRFLRAGG
jgi:hypothetical protein